MGTSTKIPKVDLSIENVWILSMDEAYSDFQDGCIQVSDGRICFVGSMLEKPDLKPKQIFNGQGMIAIPPFFNSHTHLPMSLLRGYSNDVPLKTWLEKYIWPAEAKFINSETVYLGSLLSGIEMIRSGSNIFADMYFFEDEVAKAAMKLGIRGIIGEGILDFPTPNMKTPESGFAYSERLIERYSKAELLSLSIPAHAPYTCSDETLIKVAEFSQKHKIPASIHLSETKDEVETSFSKHGKSPVRHLADLGFFDYHAVCHHSIHLSKEDIAIFKEYNVSAVTLPNSNCQLASGLAPIKEYLSEGVNIAIGTDGAASNNNTSVLSDLQLMTKLQKVAHQDPTIITAKEALRIGTYNGAKAYRMEKDLGSLEEGKKADILLIDTSAPNMQPLYDPYAQIIYAMHNEDVHSMLINGEFIMKDRIIQGIDEEEILSQVRKFGLKLDID